MNIQLRCLSLLLLLVLLGILFGCDSDGGSENLTLNPSPSAYTENDFVTNPSLRIPIFQTAVMFLEHPNAALTVDTYEAGIDAIPYYCEESTEYRFCWEDDIENAQHYMYLMDEAGNEVLRVFSKEPCVTGTINVGNYTMFLVHDGLTTDTIPVFITTNSGAGDLEPQENPGQVNGLIYSNQCPGCDLTHANLRGANLTYAYLVHANLRRVNLGEANLTHANLHDANLTWADLREANLTRANLTYANLSDAELPEANLTDANLSDADLREAYLPDANLTRAALYWANLRLADLTGADLTDADLTRANLTKADLSGATWTDGRVCADGSISSCD